MSIKDCGKCQNADCPNCFPKRSLVSTVSPVDMSKEHIFRKVASDIAELLIKKNHDYGDSFHDVYAQFGDLSTYIRLTDKLGRLKNLVKQVDMRVDESIEDVYRDIAGYCILTLVSMKRLGRDPYVSENPPESITSIDKPIRCGMCLSETIPREEGIHVCSNCGAVHSVFIVNSGSEKHYYVDKLGV